MAYSITDLITPVAQADAMNTLLGVANSLGLPTTAWQSGNPIRTMLATVAQKMADYSVVATQVARGGLGDLLSTDPWGDAWSQSIYNVFRILATQATGAVNVTNASATTYTLNPGDLIFANTTNGNTYRNIASVTIAGSSSVTGIPILADVAGTISNAAPGAITVMVSTQVGLSVTNPASVIGTDKETTPALVTRARRKLAALSPNGPKDAYNYVATSLLTVSSPITRTNTVAPGSGSGIVNIYVSNASGSVSTADIALVQAAFDASATPWGTTATAIAATPLVIPVTYQVYTKGASLSPTQMLAAINNALVTFFAGLKIGGDVIPPDTGDVYTDAITTAIANAAPGIRRVILTSPAAAVPLTSNQVAVLGTVSGVVTVLS